MIMRPKFFPIGKLSELTHCKVPTIRYYEEIGLLPEPHRTEGNQRRYAEKHLSMLRFIRHGRDLGFSLEEIRELIALSTNQNDPQHAHSIAEKHLEDVEQKIQRLNSLKSELESMVKHCKHGETHSCRVIDVLSDHSFCSSEH